MLALLLLAGCGRVGIELDLGLPDDGGADGAGPLSPGGTDAAASLDAEASLDGGIDATVCNPGGPRGLAGYWPFDEKFGDVARDLLQMRVAPLLNFVTNGWTSGQVNGALAFDGVDDVVDIGNASPQLRAVSFWIKADTLEPVAQTAWLSPSTSAGGDWDFPENAYRLDLLHSKPRPMNGSAQLWSGLGVQLPGNTTIVGIEAQVAIDNINPTATLGIELSFDGGQSFTSTGREGGLPDFERYKVFGGATDLWGRAWTAAELHDASFRVRLTKAGGPLLPLTPGVDHIRVRVYHAAIAVPRPLVALTSTARIELVGNNVSTTGLPAGTTVYIDGAVGSAVDTAWHHVVVTLPSALEAANVRVGGGPNEPYFFHGVIDELKFFNEPLTSADLTVLRTGLCP